MKDTYRYTWKVLKKYTKTIFKDIQRQYSKRRRLYKEDYMKKHIKEIYKTYIQSNIEENNEHTEWTNAFELLIWNNRDWMIMWTWLHDITGLSKHHYDSREKAMKER